jgi:hypothetical protein
MSGLELQTKGHIDDCNCLVRASLDAHTTTNAHYFGDEGNLTCFGYLNAHLVNLVDWACLLALLGALFGLASIRVDNCDTMFIGVHT